METGSHMQMHVQYVYTHTHIHINTYTHTVHIGANTAICTHAIQTFVQNHILYAHKWMDTVL